MRMSLIIPTCNEPIALWMTFMGAKSQLDHLGIDYEVIIGNNGRDNQTLHKLKDFGARVVDVEGYSTSTVRNVPARTATGDILCFSDNHVVYGVDYFKKALRGMDSGCGALFGFATMDKGGLFTHYLVKGTLHRTFNAIHATGLDPVPDKPYRAAVAGHGVWFVRRDAFERVGGYIDEQESWGGEEVGTCLLLGMYGYDLLVDPSMHHYHLPSSYRAVKRDFQKNIKNHLMAAYVVGGLEWYGWSFALYQRVEMGSMLGIDINAVKNLVQHRRDKVVRDKVMSLEALLKKYDEEGVVY